MISRTIANLRGGATVEGRGANGPALPPATRGGSRKAFAPCGHLPFEQRPDQALRAFCTVSRAACQKPYFRVGSSMAGEAWRSTDLMCRTVS
jgi:hypothetical protein